MKAPTSDEVFSPAPPDGDESDVVVIGSGFGGSVAALRFAEAGKRVVVLERGDHVRRDKFQADVDFFWNPERHAFGFHDVRARGKPIIPWLGAAVGGGSHVYAGTLKRRDDWEGFPVEIAATDMTPHYERAERMLGAATFPDWEPYASVRGTQLMYHVGSALAAAHPRLVEDWGPVHLGIAFAPRGGKPGAEFTNEHGATQRYFDPSEQSILGGDIDAKNTLDKNYLFVAAQAKTPAEIRPLSMVDRIERLDDGRFRVHYDRLHPSPGRLATFRRRWVPFRPAARRDGRSIIARHVVLAAGAVGSTELLLRNRDVHRTLPELGPMLGRRYTTNGDSLALIIPFRGVFVSWLAFVAGVVFAFLHLRWGLAGSALVYYGALVASRPPFDPDLGPTNSDNIRFRGRDGHPQGVYIEGGRYPTPGGILSAILVSGVTGHFRPPVYRTIHAAAKLVALFVPPLGALAKTWPIPLLCMGRDDATGTISLDEKGRATIDYDVASNRDYYAYVEKLGRLAADAADAYFLPNVLYSLTGRMEIPHNQGGVPMGRSVEDGVVDHAGRVFGVPNLLVLDGSTIPVSIGPNPALTIAALSERAMQIVVAQLESTGRIGAEDAR